MKPNLFLSSSFFVFLLTIGSNYFSHLHLPLSIIHYRLFQEHIQGFLYIQVQFTDYLFFPANLTDIKIDHFYFPVIPKAHLFVWSV